MSYPARFFPLFALRAAAHWWTAILLLETLDSTGSVNELLFSGKEGVAGGANLESNLRSCRTSFELIATGAGHQDFVILGMNTFFHVLPLRNHGASPQLARSKTKPIIYTIGSGKATVSVF